MVEEIRLTVEKIQGIQAVLFDFGDTLIHGNFTSGAVESVWEEVYRQVINPESHSEIAPLAQVRSAWQEYVQSAMAQTWREKTEREVDFVAVVQQAFEAVQLPRATDLTFLREVVQLEHKLLYEQIVTVAPEAPFVLAQLKKRGYKLGLVSNFCNLPEVAYTNIRAVGLLDYFDGTVLSCEVGWRKPAAPIYKAICAKLSVSPQTCLFVGDRLIEDIQGPSNQGMQTVLTTQFRHENPVTNITPNAVIANLITLLDLV